MPGAVPVRVHWSVLLPFPLILYAAGDFAAAIIGFVSYLALLLLHELGHAWVARRLQVRVFDLRLYVLHGQCVCAEPYRLRERSALAWGGVLAQVVALLFFLGLSYALNRVNLRIPDLLDPVLFVFVAVNIFTAAVNLLPFKPLDGYYAWRGLVIMG
jgi:membrane-associated protease RseP (regulator of RpoE activity)